MSISVMRGSRNSARIRSPSLFNASSWDEKIFLPALPFRISALVIAGLACISYLNSLDGDFVFDDSEAIINNQDVKSSTPIIDIFKNDFWGTKLVHPSSHKSYRPLTILSFRINYMIAGLNPYGFHVLNVVIHCLVCVLSLKVFMVLYGDAPRSAFLTSILFAVHPVHTEAVSGIVGRADLLCCLFVFISFLCYANAVERTENWLNDLVFTSGSRLPKLILLNLGLVAIFSAVAMLCKEVGITALGICSVYDLMINQNGVKCKNIILAFTANIRSIRNIKKELSEDSVRYCLIRHLYLLIIGIILLICRWVAMGSKAPGFKEIDNPASFLDTFVLRALNYQYIYCLNCSLLILPIWLCFDWSMGCVPLITSLLDPRLLSLLVLWVIFGGLFSIGLLRYSSKLSRYIFASLALCLVPFLPASNLFFTVGFVVAERLLYLPSAGYCFIVVVGLRQLLSSGYGNKHFLRVAFSLLVLTFVLKCRRRNFDWANEQRLFSSGLDVCPLNAKVHYNLGKLAVDAGNIDEGIARYKYALKLNKEYDQAMNNLANILKDKGQLEESLFLLQNATKLRPDFAAAWMNLGIVQVTLGDLTRAEVSYLTALKHRSVYPDCLYNLGNLYLELGRDADAINAWTNATFLKPTLAVAWTNMLILLDSIGHYDRAVSVGQQALNFLPNDSSIHFNLANTLGKLGRYEESESFFKSAIYTEPNNANFWANLGVLYHRWKRFDLAKDAYKKALSLNPSLKSPKDNLSMLLKTKSKKGKN